MRLTRLWFVLFCLLPLCLSLGACQSIVRTDIETFRANETALKAGRVLIVPMEKWQSSGDSLEFKFYRDKLAAKLQSLGLTPVNTGDAEYLAKLGYRVSRQEKDDPHSRVLIGGHVGYGRFYPSTSLVLTDLNRERYEYVREVGLALETFENNADASKLVQVKATSIGGCQHLTVVYDEMLDAIFKDLWRENGSVVNVKTKGSARCP